MDLWTEFEGVTIDSAFALTKLLQTEGRSAFFSTLNENGESVLIRIIECHFDEDDILARWRGVQSLGHSNFLCLDRFGQFQIKDNGITAVYAVFERVDANLGEVLERGRLSAADAVEIGLGVASALEILHANGFVHEHVTSRNVYAAGDTVKLRSDCIRETPEGEAGMEARRQDAHDLATVLIEVLLGSAPDSSALHQISLPAQFADIVRNALNGTWGLAEIKTALGRCDVPKAARRKTTAPGPTLTKAASPAKTPVPPAESLSITEVAANPPQVEKSVVPDRPHGGAAFADPRPVVPVLLPGQKPSPLEEVPVIFGISEHDFRKWTTIGALVLGVVLLGWIVLDHWSGHRAAEAQPVTAPADVASAHDIAMPPAAGSSVDPPAPQSVLTVSAPKAGSQPAVQWRVVAFTYNHQDQAQKKASSLAQQHPGLSPAIFSPTGKAPWLVTVGGLLQRDAAFALARNARALGLPRDTYAQDYTAR
jgi:hypothetical protein